MSVGDRPLQMPDMALPRQRTFFFRFRPTLLPGIAMAAILVAGLLSSVYAFLIHADRLPLAATTTSGAIQGEITAAMGKFLQSQNPLSEPLVMADRVINWVALGDLGPRVRQGCPGWLFLTDEF